MLLRNVQLAFLSSLFIFIFNKLSNSITYIYLDNNVCLFARESMWYWFFVISKGLYFKYIYNIKNWICVFLLEWYKNINPMVYNIIYINWFESHCARQLIYISYLSAYFKIRLFIFRTFTNYVSLIDSFGT